MSTDYGRENDQVTLIDVVNRDFELSRGSSLPLGATICRGGVNFSVFSQQATAMSLVLFLPGAERPLAVFPLDPRYNRTGHIWHALVRGLDCEIEYGYAVDSSTVSGGASGEKESKKILVDPYSRSLSGGEEWGRAGTCAAVDQLGPTRRSRVVDENFDWEFDQPLNIPLSDSVIYELHVRGFTRHESSGVNLPGTYAGLIEKIPYLKSLGITAVELLPINEFAETDTDRINPMTGERLLNYWGYHSINFFAPKASYSSDRSPGGEIREFKTLVKAFHDAGIEVILDMVFNHTAEGDERGQTFSFRGLDNEVYYLIDPATGDYLNFSGCGNTLNCNHPVVRNMILDCLRYWVTEMHVDGFRFDLASILGRGRDGSVLSSPPLLERISADPILAHTKLIAEAWDAAGLYQVGSFPAWGRWAEWNGKYRDDVRRYMKGDGGMVGALVQRLMGSPDIYSRSGREAQHSINFVTCHDGFTLADLVSYDRKHNEANGEGGCDGTNENLSWNCGFEGETSDPEITTLRLRQMKNLAAILLLSRGVPMILAGDELGRSQGGNNNAYCQDNKLNWIDWGQETDRADLLRFFRPLVAFRMKHPALRRTGSEGEGDFPVIWHGVKAYVPDWSSKSRCLAFQTTETDIPGDRNTDIYVAISAYWEPLVFELPELREDRKWHRVLDTTLDSPEDIVSEETAPVLRDQEKYEVGPRSVVVFVGQACP